MLEESKEIWKEIDGFEGLYAVSSKGNIKNLKSGRILGEYYNSDGYRFVILKGKNFKIHRLVALAFLDNPDNLTEVNHKNERKDDNNVSNLEWCSKSYNVNYSSHKYSCKIKQLTKDGELVKIWESSMQIERETGYSNGSIINACKGRQPYSHGFQWQYVNTDSQRVMNRPIVVYKGDDYVGTFASAVKASEALGLKYGSVNLCLHGRLATLKGYRFKYAE